MCSTSNTFGSSRLKLYGGDHLTLCFFACGHTRGCGALRAVARPPLGGGGVSPTMTGGPDSKGGVLLVIFMCGYSLVGPLNLCNE